MENIKLEINEKSEYHLNNLEKYNIKLEKKNMVNTNRNINGFKYIISNIFEYIFQQFNSINMYFQNHHDLVKKINSIENRLDMLESQYNSCDTVLDCKIF